MTNLGTVVILAVQLGAANFLAAESGVVQVGHRAGDLLLLLAAVTFVFQRFFALATVTHVALLLASVNSAVQWFRTDRLACDIVFLATLQRFRHAATSAAALDHCLTWRTRSWMTEKRAGMLAKVLPAAKLPTRVRNVAPIVLWILLLATEAEILPRNLLRNVLTGRTTPTVIRQGRIGPLRRTVQVKNVIAVRAGPNRLRRTDQLATHETLHPA